ncbi:helix-turn-helix transcriptional regulator [Acidovorax sp. NCPPB 3859]|nr:MULTISPECIES: helix-turn-helix transcriptional regulator [unclassified Acidovorax]MDA8450396.1 helix-turn-helix transcriptional regulator [Acidovorax sp. GBBC 3297]MDA8459930.1 helix-turn-helix transcriptional regulator [Acidovorax sp. GBBC 3333]MDA8464966.1 helix-turn-helix transcriptional regulator [Acidovorax sp. GBBC 3332]MDA8469911.1 helix-turn-helix transcriptional regulator [Acidovorax sp. GBBC 3299]WCM77492.1 helix-turn-helix transcriptional regulator [Acidovorax sp. GBBC 712]
MHESTARLYQAASEIKDVSGQSAVARLLGESPQNLKNWEVRGVSKAGALKAEELIGCSAAWVLTGDGPAARRGEAPTLPRSLESSVSVPRLANTASMGAGSEMAPEDVMVGHLTLSPAWIGRTLRGLSTPENLRFIHAYGDSMEPTFLDGDVLLVDAGVRTLEVDGVYVLAAQNRLFIKRVRQRLDGAYEISSDNPTVKTVDVLEGKHAVEILGKVIWIWNGRKI